jgi:alpha-1,6-mannosyltransferase
VTAISSPASQWRWPRATTAALACLGGLTVASYVYGAQPRLPDAFPFRDVALVQVLLFGCSAWIILTKRVSRPAFAVILAVAMLCRMALVFAQPTFSTDVYRYVWDGRVQGAGINPYRYIPADPALAHLRDASIYPRINRRDYAHTIYPPMAEAIFFAVTRISQSITDMKAAMVGFEAVTIWTLCILLGRLGLPPARVLLYAWHPLVLWQYAGDGHIDAAAITFVVIALLAHARRRETLTGIALGCATLVKLYPALLFPALYRRWGWKMPAAMAATFIAGYLPYLGAGPKVIGFIPGYAREEGILTGGRFFLVSLARRAGLIVPPAVYVGAAVIALLLIAYRVLREQDRTALGDVRHGAVIATAFVVLFSTHYLWYFAWIVPFLCFVPAIALLYLTGTATFLYSALGYRPLLGLTGEMPAFDAGLYVPFALLALGERWHAVAGRRQARKGRPIRPAARPTTAAERAELAGREM